MAGSNTGASPPGDDDRRLPEGERQIGERLAGRAERTPLDVVKDSIDDTFLHLVSAGLVGTHPRDLVIETLKRLMVEAHQLHGDDSPARRWRAS